MIDPLHNLMDGFLDDQLSPDELSQLNDCLKGDPENARRLARSMLLHDRMRAEAQAGALSGAPSAALSSAVSSALSSVAPDASSHDRVLSRPARRRLLPRKRWTLTAAAVAAALLLSAGLLWHGAAVSSASAASVALDRMIAAAGQAIDREYRIRVTDPGPEGPASQVSSREKGRKPGLDGASLFVRGSDQFVLIRRFADGTEFVTGSDGEIGWAVAPRGHVHLSRDIRRFRRAAPGEHQEIPFVDLRSGFAELRRGYDIVLSPVDPADADGKTESQFVAVKRRAKRGGPERIRIAFDSAGVAHRIELSGLPADETRARGVALDLVGQRDLGPDFFKHEAHHDADRPIDWE